MKSMTCLPLQSQQSIPNFISPVSYIINTDGTNYYAQNGFTSNVDFINTDGAYVLQSALNNAGPNGDVKIISDIIVNSNIIVPVGIALTGTFVSAYPIRDYPSNSWINAMMDNRKLILNNANSIFLNSGSSLKNIFILSKDFKVLGTSGAPVYNNSAPIWNGNAIMINGSYPTIRDFLIVGFNLGIYLPLSVGIGGVRIEDGLIDCINGISLNRTLDVSYLTNIHFNGIGTNWGIGCTSGDYTCLNNKWGQYRNVRTGTAIYLNDVDGAMITGTFSHGYKTGVHVDSRDGLSWSIALIGTSIEQMEPYNIQNSDTYGIAVTNGSQVSWIGGQIDMGWSGTNKSYGIYVDNTSKFRSTAISQCCQANYGIYAEPNADIQFSNIFPFLNEINYYKVGSYSHNGNGEIISNRNLDIYGGNLNISSVGHGITMKSPDGTKTKCISIDNNGNLVINNGACS